MFISIREYEQLVAKAESCDHIYVTNESLRRVIADHDREDKLKETTYVREITILKEDQKRAIEQMQRESKEAIRAAGVDKETSIREAVEAATDELKAENRDLTIQKERYADRASMLEKAFENMGFDVKDMKEILGKLVDGLIAKHEINVIKTS